MRAADAGWLLSAIARGGVVDVPDGREVVLMELRERGLVREAASPGEERSHLALLRDELDKIAALRSRGPIDAATSGRERGLRTAIVEISERLAESEGAAEVRALGRTDPFRGALRKSARYQVTLGGRALLNALGPRGARAGDITLDRFEAEMKALREAFRHRAVRAGEIAAALGNREELGLARASVPVGLAAVRAPGDRAARAFTNTFRALRAAGGPFTAEQDAALAECACLAVSDLSWCERPDASRWLHGIRSNLLALHVPGNPEDAVDAAALLATVPEAEHAGRIELARELAATLVERGTTTTLSLALLVLGSESSVPPHLPALLADTSKALAAEVPDDWERISVVALLAFPRGELRAQVERWRALRQYLMRFSPDGMSIAAAMLSWLALEPPEILDDLRLASAELARARIGGGGAEGMALAIKQLVSMAALAAGAEGDREETLALAPVAAPRLAEVGLHGALGALPLATTALSAFHRTVLDAAVAWESSYHPTHSSYVYGSSRRWGWG